MEDVVAQAAARGRKRYDIEDPQAPSWVLHRKHIFILSSAGKPIFSRYGDESKMAPLAGVLQALISFVRDTGDHIRHVRAGAHRMVFVTRGSLYLVGVSSSGDSVPYIARQLHFLHAQIISILTAKVETIFQKNASFDLRGLLGGTDRVLRTLIREGSSEPTMLLQATPCLRMPAATRAELGRLLAATRPAALLFGVLLSRGFLVQLLRLKRTPLHPHDLVLVSADAPAPPRQIHAAPACLLPRGPVDRPLPPHQPGPSPHPHPSPTPSRPPPLHRPYPKTPNPKQTGDEHGQLVSVVPRGRDLASSVPPQFQPARDALRAHLVRRSGALPRPHHHHRRRVRAALALPPAGRRAPAGGSARPAAPPRGSAPLPADFTTCGCPSLAAAGGRGAARAALPRDRAAAVRRRGGRSGRVRCFSRAMWVLIPLPIHLQVGAAEIRHFIYRLAAHAQFTAPRTGPLAGPQCPYRDRAAVKGLLRRYQHAHQRVHAGGKPLREYLQTTEAETIVAWTSSEHELYVVLGPLVSKPVAIAASHKLLRWLRKEQPTLFFAPVAK